MIHQTQILHCVNMGGDKEALKLQFVINLLSHIKRFLNGGVKSHKSEIVSADLPILHTIYFIGRLWMNQPKLRGLILSI